MFWAQRRNSGERLFVILREQSGIFGFALGDHTKVFSRRETAVTEAARLASKYNDGRYFVFQAVSVSEVVSPRAVTRSLSGTVVGAETTNMSTVHDEAPAD